MPSVSNSKCQLRSGLDFETHRPTAAKLSTSALLAPIRVRSQVQLLLAPQGGDRSRVVAQKSILSGSMSKLIAISSIMSSFVSWATAT